MNYNQDNNLDIGTLENWLWEAACKIRGEIDAPKYKDYILPIIFIKRLSDVFEDEIKEWAGSDNNENTFDLEQLLSKDHGVVRFYLPPHARWSEISKKTTDVGQFLTDAVRSIARENPKLQGVLDTVDFNASAAGQRIISDDKLKSLIDVLGRYRLGIDDVEPDIFGRAYEYLLRKFAEGSGQSAGEFYTPREVAVLMANILNPKPGMEIYDPCAGSGGLLVKCQLQFKDEYQYDYNPPPLHFYGQENLAPTYAMAKMNMFIHDMEADIFLGDTMNYPKTVTSGSLQVFDLVTANPMWNQNFEQSVYENDRFDRFKWGYPPSGSADWAWVQHMFASLKDNGKMAVVLDTGAVSRGSGNTGKNRERDIRKMFIEKNLVEAVILLPENLFYNTTAPGIILVINKKPAHDGIMLINASKLFKKGKPKNYLPDDAIRQAADIYLEWKEEERISKIISKEEAVKNDYNLSPSRYVANDGGEEALPLEEAILLLKQAEEERKEADEKMKSALENISIR